MPTRRNWSKEELILSLNLYLKLPFGKLHSRTPEIIELSKLIGRTPGAVAMRLNNFASVDPYHRNRGIRGLEGGYNQVKPVWEEFEADREDFIFKSEKLLAQYENKSVEDKYKNSLKDLDISSLKGETRISQVKSRVNQNVFRELVLANYNSQCAISGIHVPKFLVASHIIPWSDNVKERLNPENGICLSPLFDKAFDTGFIGINKKYQVVISNKLIEDMSEKAYIKFFKPFKDSTINLPSKYLQKKEFLEYHLDQIFLH